MISLLPCVMNMITLWWIEFLCVVCGDRCGIPVVVMGETGCGKTRLIRYMCDLARQDRSVTNMVIMKVRFKFKV